MKYVVFNIRGSEGITPLIHNLCTSGGGRLALRLDLTIQEKYPLVPNA
jgi:hypothetical protein